MYFAKVISIGLVIKDMWPSKDLSLAHIRKIALKIKEKYDKYCGNPEKLNMLLLISFVLDPRKKMVYARRFIEKNFIK